MVWLGWKGPYRSHSTGMVGLEGSLKVTELQNGWIGMEGSLKITESWNGWVGMEGSLKMTE